MKDESAGWIHRPQYSPDGSRIAVRWNRILSLDRQMISVWVVSLRDATESMVLGEAATPVAWSADGNWIYVIKRSPAPALWRVRGDGHESEVVARLPFKDVSGYGHVTPEGTKIVCSVPETQSDVWLVDDFDLDER